MEKQFAPSLNMPEEWDGRLESLEFPIGVDSQMVKSAMDLVWEWEASSEPSPAPLVLMIFSLLVERLFALSRDKPGKEYTKRFPVGKYSRIRKQLGMNKKAEDL